MKSNEKWKKPRKDAKKSLNKGQKPEAEKGSPDPAGARASKGAKGAAKKAPAGGRASKGAKGAKGASKKAPAGAQKRGTKGSPDPTKGRTAKDAAKKGRRRRKKRQKPRDWRLDNEFSKVKKAMFYDEVIAAVDARPPPWADRTGRRGRPGFGARELAKCVIVMTEEGLSVRDMVAHLHAHPDLLRRIGLDDVPSKSTLARARRRLPTQYLRSLSSFIAKSAPGAGGGGGEEKKRTDPSTAPGPEPRTPRRGRT